ncbi:hypothetical protein DICVIV_05744 [Dictyocaulus viviparus]|uniref:Uncharacterized protein n=1 Tax=Dictyocaulus viviparus TaxID=29172 RepID=A0A0D8XWP2_DICVI|nr:hypothetical protein DICVIV_05744 [Dictyocaulus viviparus]
MITCVASADNCGSEKCVPFKSLGRNIMKILVISDIAVPRLVVANSKAWDIMIKSINQRKMFDRFAGGEQIALRD